MAQDFDEFASQVRILHECRVAHECDEEVHNLIQRLVIERVGGVARDVQNELHQVLDDVLGQAPERHRTRLRELVHGDLSKGESVPGLVVPIRGDDTHEPNSDETIVLHRLADQPRIAKRAVELQISFECALNLRSHLFVFALVPLSLGRAHQLLV